MDVQAISKSLVIDEEMSALIRDVDWTNTSLGPSAQWPLSLRTSLRIILAANLPMALYWGPENVLLYNNAWRALIGERHPRALGRPAGAMSPELWETIGPMVPGVISGKGVGEASDQLLRVNRNGRVEDAWFTYTLSSVPIEDGTIGGILTVAFETTARVTAEREMRARKDRHAFLMGLGTALRNLANPRAVMGVAAESLGRYLAADRVGYAEIEDQGAFFTIYQDWSVPGMPTLAGRRRLDAVGPALIRELRSGRTVTFEDALSNPRALAKTNAAAYRRVKTRAAIIVPLIKNGRFAAALYVHSREPRQWTDEQEELVRNVAELSWAAIERARAEDALRESERRFRLIADAAPFPMWLAQRDGKRTFINQAFVKFLGKPYNEALDFDWHQIVHPDHSDIITKDTICEEVSEQPRPREARCRNAAGEWRWLRFESQSRLDGNGVHVGFIGAAYDITAAKHATLEVQALHESLEARVEERTQERDRVWAISRDLLVVIGVGSIIRAVNPAWKTILGHDPSDVIGQSLLDFVYPDDFDLTNIGIDSAGSKIDVTNFQNRCKHKDGTLRWVSWHTSAEGDLVYAYGRDVTAKEEQATALRQAEEALRQSQKMEAVGQLTGGVAHDFNNLLQGISSALEMLARRHVHSETGHKLIDLANASIDRGAHLTRHLLAFARKQQLVARSTDVSAAIGASGELLMRSLGGEVVIERQLHSDVWPAMADPNQLDVAILNLVLNARDAMPSGGTITIGAENFGSSAPNPPADLVKGDYVRVSVTDVGTGMSEDIRARIFEPFFTTKGVGKGTGLGLSQVHGFAHQSGGTVRVLSSPGRGTTVEIFLPRAITQGEGKAVQVDPMGWRGTETVLVVDDDRDVRELAVACLGEFGYRVLEADSGPHGLEVLSHEGSVDLLLVDFLMPAMNGAELVRLARRMRPDLKVIFMTGYADLEAVTEHADPDDIIYKPFKMAALAEQIGGALAGRARV